MGLNFDRDSGNKVAKYINSEDGIDEETQGCLNYGIELDSNPQSTYIQGYLPSSRFLLK